MSAPTAVTREYRLVPSMTLTTKSVKEIEDRINQLASEGFQLRTDGESGVFIMERQTEQESPA